MTIPQIEKWLSVNLPQSPADIGTSMADLAFPPSPSSGYAPDRCFLQRTARGTYRLRKQWRSDSKEAAPRRSRTTRKEFIEANGATCANWTWSWSFIDAKRRMVIFGAWDMHTEGNRALILSEAWQVAAGGKRSSGYGQSREHVRLIEEEGYELYTFPMFNSNQNVLEDGGGPAVIDAFVPELSLNTLIKLGPNWYASDGLPASFMADELVPSVTYPEGAVTTVTINGYERNRQARDACLAHYGAVCAICAFDFEGVYGPIARSLVHVHHKKPLANIGTTYMVDPIQDLIPVCPNCHAVIHSTRVPLEIEHLREVVRGKRRQ